MYVFTNKIDYSEEASSQWHLDTTLLNIHHRCPSTTICICYSEPTELEVPLQLGYVFLSLEKNPSCFQNNNNNKTKTAKLLDIHNN